MIMFSAAMLVFSAVLAAWCFSNGYTLLGIVNVGSCAVNLVTLLHWLILGPRP